MPRSPARLQNAVATAGAELRAAGRLQPEDLPTLLLACEYAGAIDAAEGPLRGVVLKELGPRLHETMTALGMSPAARAKVVGKGPDTGAPAPTSKRDDLRQRRADRAQRAAGG